MQHGWRPNFSPELIHASSIVARYRGNLPTFKGSISPRFAARFKRSRWIFRTWDTSLVGWTSIPVVAPAKVGSPYVGGNDDMYSGASRYSWCPDCFSFSVTRSAIHTSLTTRSGKGLYQTPVSLHIHGHMIVFSPGASRTASRVILRRNRFSCQISARGVQGSG